MSNVKTLAEVTTEQFINNSTEFSKLRNKIAELQKELSEAKKERDELRKIVGNMDITVFSNNNKPDLNVTDEESICRIQLKILNQISLNRELTLEETKKVSEYSKILNMLQDKPKKIEISSVEKLDTETLLKIANASFIEE